jgi:hypothetical protein
LDDKEDVLQRLKSRGNEIVSLLADAVNNDDEKLVRQRLQEFIKEFGLKGSSCRRCSTMTMFNYYSDRYLDNVEIENNNGISCRHIAEQLATIVACIQFTARFRVVVVVVVVVDGWRACSLETLETLFSMLQRTGAGCEGVDRCLPTLKLIGFF